MAIYNGPARGGTRGGKDQFNWEDVKEDHQRENYLGHAVMAPVGRWQKRKDLNWYTKAAKHDLEAKGKDDMTAVKAREADLMAQMLGEKPMEAPKSEFTRIEKNKLLKKGNAEEGTIAAALGDEKFGERIEGLGYAAVKVDNLMEQLDTTTRETQEGYEGGEGGVRVDVNALLRQHAEGAQEADGHEGHHDDTDYAALLAAMEAPGAGALPSHDGGKGDKKSRRELKKAIKEEKKRLKKEKKEAKKEKKRGREGNGGALRHDSDSSPSPPPHRERGRERQRSRERGPGRDRSRDRERDRRSSRSRSRSRDRRSRSRDRR